MQKINLMAPINPLGYGVVGFNVTKELSKANEVSLFPIGNPEVTTQEEADLKANHPASEFGISLQWQSK